MYLKKQNVSIKMLIVCVVMFVVTFSLPLAVSGDGDGNKGPEVEEIYNQIRDGGPLYQWEESIVTFENEGMTLVCSLTIPDTPKKPPIVITLNGFGDTRDSLPVGDTGEGILQRNSRVLAEHGFASLRVDFRGSGDSDGDYGTMTFSTQISDAMAAVQYVCTRLKHQVNTRKIGMLGFSQGSLVGSVTASKDKRVDSLVLWVPVSHPPIVYEGLLTKEGLKRGLNMESGESQIFQLYVNDQYIYWDVLLGKAFFEDLYNVSPIAAIRGYKKPLLVVVASEDAIIWPQPAMGQVYLTYHKGKEKLVNVMGADHTFNFSEGPEKVDQFIYWAAAWFIKTLKHKEN